MTLPAALLGLAVTLQIGFALAWIDSLRRLDRDVRDGLVGREALHGPDRRPTPGRRARLAGLAGAACGLGYAFMARDPVFLFGQAALAFLTARAAPAPSDGTSDSSRRTDHDQRDRDGRRLG